MDFQLNSAQLLMLRCGERVSLQSVQIVDAMAGQTEEVEVTLLPPPKAQSPCLSGSEAVTGFCAWLTTRSQVTKMSACDDAAPIAQLMERFCVANDLGYPRDGWEKILEHPKEEEPSEPKVYDRALTKLEFPSTVKSMLLSKEITPQLVPGLQSHSPSEAPKHFQIEAMERALKNLSGDLNHNNVAAAKQILKDIIESAP